MHARFASLVLVLLLPALALADLPPSFEPFDLRSGDYLAEVRPSEGGGGGERDWRVTVFEGAGGVRRELWSAPILHTGRTHQHHLAPDGKTFVSVEEWYLGDWPVVRLYREGALLAECSGEDLQVPAAALRQTMNFQLWLKSEDPARVRLDARRLHLRLGDGTTRAIDLASGRLEGLPDADGRRPVATCSGAPPDRAVGRLMALLLAAGVDATSTSTAATTTISAPAREAPRARRIVTRVIEAERLEASVAPR